MSAHYLVRFDDICPTMDWARWSRIESMLLATGVRPLLAVIPDNQDAAFQVSPARGDFWDYLRERQRSQGWAIAMHGLQHRYHAQAMGGLLRLNTNSEFTGLPRAEQQAKIRAGLQVFRSHDVDVDGWIAPAHNFDAVTVDVLLEEGIRFISDGFFPRPVRHLAACWVPQQLWKFRAMPFGLWTVCLHHAAFAERDFERLEADLNRFGNRIVSWHDVTTNTAFPDATLLDHAFFRSWQAAMAGKARLRAWRWSA